MYVLLTRPTNSSALFVRTIAVLAAAASDGAGVGLSDAPANHHASVIEYEPADAFSGVRPGLVFTTRDGRSGYFKDANPFTTWSAVPAAPISYSGVPCRSSLCRGCMQFIRIGCEA
jgi:hypothetical protein